MTNIPKLLITVGVILIVLGILWQVVGRFFPIGKLPGDIFFKKGNTTFYFPIVTSIVLSVVISLILYLVGRLR
ncbi:DUF2905 domain-containing protein [Anaerobacillus isosaccharinicus]|uniref:DUF2905 domain-containing protein n=1 Tax=Anaerobacillus isosaccharinicus TaxID=1532552 RepID=A0A1S2KW77_9BACI|nr:DUF2905 domain-containing protein [Anaerobacillus isosaccharinicus]MBA5585351.1 DUF2905 domain-containing protein [Anaerobacillus isosaccharinicus]QOY36326.1 DUF2905 domain-containing protein [Anaerobacillus isosaccharinicus]